VYSFCVGIVGWVCEMLRVDRFRY